MSDEEKEQIERHKLHAVNRMERATRWLGQSWDNTATNNPTAAKIAAQMALEALKEATARVEGMILNMK